VNHAAQFPCRVEQFETISSFFRFTSKNQRGEAISIRQRDLFGPADPCGGDEDYPPEIWANTAK